MRIISKLGCSGEVVSSKGMQRIIVKNFNVISCKCICILPFLCSFCLSLFFVISLFHSLYIYLYFSSFFFIFFLPFLHFLSPSLYYINLSPPVYLASFKAIVIFPFHILVLLTFFLSLSLFGGTSVTYNHYHISLALFILFYSPFMWFFPFLVVLNSCCLSFIFHSLFLFLLLSLSPFYYFALTNYVCITSCRWHRCTGYSRNTCRNTFARKVCKNKKKNRQIVMLVFMFYIKGISNTSVCTILYISKSMSYKLYSRVRFFAVVMLFDYCWIVSSKKRHLSCNFEIIS